MKTFGLIIAGSRGFSDYDYLVEFCDHMLSNVKNDYDITIISGTARGADTLGERYAKDKGYSVARFPADWSLGKKAGYVRNKVMAESAKTYDKCGCLIFRVNNSKGSAHMYNIAKNLNIPVFIKNF